MDKRSMVERQGGKPYVLYAGLLAEARDQGPKAIKVELLQAPTAENGRLAVVKATVEVERGSFEGLGDASPENVAKPMLPYLFRLSETRAKARALRDTVDVGFTVLEETDVLVEFQAQAAALLP